jgi:hypothetical protein
VLSSIDTARLLTAVRCQSVSDQVSSYCTELMTEAGVMASGLGVLGSDKLFDENAPEVSPGGMLNKYGYLAIATSVGGNALAVQVETGFVYWAGRSSFVDEVEVAIRQPSGDYEYRTYSPEAVEAAMTSLSKDLSGFLYMLLADELTEKMNELDS